MTIKITFYDFWNLRKAANQEFLTQMVRVLEVVQAGLKSPEHDAFVQQLQKYTSLK
ncbi:hypothetical protein [Nostoc sp.]|uniref:hypothetical protein n=1 Tax=Nostoc sp. TaxID=1180 RepID=UPI002FF7B879